jgi:hypothetical protein
MSGCRVLGLRVHLSGYSCVSRCRGRVWWSLRFKLQASRMTRAELDYVIKKESKKTVLVM